MNKYHKDITCVLVQNSPRLLIIAYSLARVLVPIFAQEHFQIFALIFTDSTWVYLHCSDKAKVARQRPAVSFEIG